MVIVDNALLPRELENACKDRHRRIFAEDLDAKELIGNQVC